MRKEEAEMLRIKGIDKKRENLLKSIGLEGSTSTEVIEALDEDRKTELLPLFNMVREKTDKLKELSVRNKSIIESKLAKAELMVSGAGSSAYGKDGRISGGSRETVLRTTSV
jgi:flagellar biosynthesis/type III secretory pathway chaperone